MMLYNKKKEGISQGEKAFIVSTFNKEVLKYDFLFTWFCIVCVLSLLHYFMNLAYKPIAENEGLRARLKAQKQRKDKQL